ncbi:sulfatase-like hydrolase/transferase [Anatilimnocola floriformis]|uniref:sulfatase-like hydrolase/transferase n=1 Tax=Anatilimnocola floriformis TaxID=2948575 RepID=UPI0020C56830|nr:sulfatase-like hydrolase/transferase [Anatilimnocola floriformis]
MKLAPLFCFLILALSATAFAAESRPHIVLVLADDLGLGDLSCYGGEVVKTPHLDQLAKEGTRFTKYYSPAPICSPARCGLITGQFPAQWNITSFLQDKKGNRGCEQADFLDAKAPSLPRILKSAGYATAHFGKWHLGGGRDVTEAPKFAAYGYDESAGTWESPEPHPDITATNWIWSDQDKVKRWDRSAFFVDRTLQFIKDHADQPCFVNVWLDDPHTPWIPEDKKKEDQKPQSLDNLRKVMTEVDKQVGRLAKELPPNTLLIFISDNGPLPTFQGKRATGHRGSKLSLYEGGINLPFIARWPGKVPAEQVNDTALVAGVDFLPTFASIAGAKLPADYVPDGEDLTPALLGKTFERSKPIYWEYGRNETVFKYPGIAADRSPQLALREGDWKVLVNSDSSGLELFNIASDARETKNVANENAVLAAKMRDKLLAWKRSLPKLADR